eukprot:359469-Chlamydomonas_euryale.AAC.6
MHLRFATGPSSRQPAYAMVRQCQPGQTRSAALGRDRPAVARRRKGMHGPRLQACAARRAAAYIADHIVPERRCRQTRGDDMSVHGAAFAADA